MILLVNPRATRRKNARYPLSILAIAGVIEGREDYQIVDGNIDENPLDSLDEHMRRAPARLLAVTVMPGPQTHSAVPLCHEFRKRHPNVPIVWGGYFPSLYPDAALNAPYVDYLVRGQGEETFLELLDALEGKRELRGIAGLSFKDQFGLPVHNPERPLRSPGDFPPAPYHRLDPDLYLMPTFLGSRTTVYQASIGCPYKCNFCGVVPFSGAREKVEPPDRTASVLGDLSRRYGVNAVQFYDNNFFLREDHARELADRLAPLKLRWWCEARVDAVMRFSDDTLRALRRSGLVMIFCGVESGSDARLKEMQKQLTVRQSLELARRIREFDIVPEYSVMFGHPEDPQGNVRETIEFVRTVKNLNPDVEIVVQTYVPVHQREGNMYGDLESFPFPRMADEWASERWLNFSRRTDPRLPWLPREVKDLIDNFEIVMNSRWPTIQDGRLRPWGRALLKSLASWRYALGVYGNPLELRWAQKMVRLRQPKFESL